MVDDVEKNKSFNFSIEIEKDGNAIDAAEIISNKLNKTATGQYTFALKHSEKVELYVYNNCKVTVSEDDYSKKKDVDTKIFSDDYYVTSWEKDSKVTDGRIISIDSVNSDQELVCNNVYNDLGDVEVQGFQMNGNKDSGGVSEFSPSFRVVCRVSKNTIKTKKVSKFGVIYAIANATDGKTRAELEEMMKIDKADNKTIKVHEETDKGIYPYWTTKEDSKYSAKYWQYYALTFKCLDYMFYTLQENITVRAYAKMADGTYEYGNSIYTVNMYEIADYLYKNQKMSTLKGHNFLYNNVLNLVTINNNRLDILNRSNDGFYIASEDLKLRGPGDFFGVRQSGDFEFKIGDIMNDAKVLKEAAQAADLIENNQVEVTDEEKEILKYQDTGIINI